MKTCIDCKEIITIGNNKTLRCKKCNKIKKSERRRNYYLNNKDKIIKKQTEKREIRRKTDPYYKLLINLRQRLRNSIKNTETKNIKTINLIGCDTLHLKKHLESKFIIGMSWDNYGRYGWHIDHIIPCASFDLTNPEQQKLCFHYTNLQPLWAIDNIKKSNTISLEYDNLKIKKSTLIIIKIDNLIKNFYKIISNKKTDKNYEIYKNLMIKIYFSKDYKPSKKEIKKLFKNIDYNKPSPEDLGVI